MAITAFPQVKLPGFSQLGLGGLNRSLEKTGQSPPVGILIKPLSGAETISIDRFIAYNFSSSILIPVDTFSFQIATPDGPPLTNYINDGDIAVLNANNVAVSTGIIDVTETETDPKYGEKSSVSGRDTMGQLEDQDAVSLTSKPIYANSISIEAGVRLICQDTKFTQFEFRDIPSPKPPPLLASDPGESKLAVLQRFLEPYNIVAWTGPSGQLIVGKPNMSQGKKGDLVCSKADRFSNVLQARVTRSATSIANIMVAMWQGQETIVARVPPQQILNNNAPGPSRLRKSGYLVPKSVVFSNVNAQDSQGLSGVNAIQAGGSTVLQAYAKREIARQNVNEIIVQMLVQGHYNDLGEPYVIDTVYNINYDRGAVSEDMYLFSVEYQLSDQGQFSVLSFCRFGSIVADIRAPGTSL